MVEISCFSRIGLQAEGSRLVCHAGLRALVPGVVWGRPGGLFFLEFSRLFRGILSILFRRAFFSGVFSFIWRYPMDLLIFLEFSRVF